MYKRQDLINPGGSMTGGAFKNSSNLLSRRREVEELEKKTGTLKLAMEDLSAQVEELKALRAGCYAKNDELQQILQKDYVVQNTARMNSEQIERRIWEIQRSVAVSYTHLLNKGTCDCEDTSLDPRMSVVRDLFKNFKEV